MTIIILSGCSTHGKALITAGLLGSVLGAGAGYAFIHHGEHREYEMQNTIISSAIFALAFAGATYYHYESLDSQKVELASRFSRNVFLEEDQQKDLTPTKFQMGKYSLKLDEGTRWIFPQFRKERLKEERSDTDITLSHYRWQILRPGYFVTEDQVPTLFKEEK